MKVKVRGLVFVGFAAAVFAQSAFAAIYQNDYSTVASKRYVDDYAQEETEKVQIGSETGQFASTSAENFPWDSNDRYPSMKVLKEVKDSLDDINVVEGSTGYVDVTENPTGTFTVDLVSGNITGTVTSTNTSSTKLVTEGAVANYAEDKTNKATSITTTNASSTTEYTSVAAVTGYAEATANKLGYDTTNSTETITGNKTDDTKFPTVKNVYEFVKSENAAYQPKVADNTHTKIYVGRDDGTNGATWGELSGATNGYVAFTGSGGDYTVDIDSNKLATTSANITTGSSDLATAGAVYDFVNGNYQPKTTGTDVMVGYNGTWRSLSGDSYITVGADTNGSSVTLTNLTNATTDFVASDDTNAGTKRPKLAKAGDVYDFVMAQTGGLAIPEMPDECDTAAASNHYCALVYGKTSDGANAPVGLMWTIMAPQS